MLEGNYPPKVVEKPKPVTPPVQAAPTTPPMAPSSVPKSPDISTPAAQPSSNVVPFPSASAAPAAPGQSASPVPQAQTAPAAPAAADPGKSAEGAQDRENGYETKIVLKGDRLRKYFPDVSMTPREIEDSIYDALEMRRQMQEKAKQKAEIFGKEKKGPVK